MQGVRNRKDHMPSPFDSRAFRNALGMFATGVTVVTSGKHPNFHGMTVNAFSSLSLEPPLVLVCVDTKTQMHSVLKETGSFTVNVLSRQQEAASRYFATSGRDPGLAQFENFPFALGKTGTPQLKDAICVLDCTVHSVAEGGDHDIYVGEVKALEFQDHDDPLLFYRGRYRGLQSEKDL